MPEPFYDKLDCCTLSISEKNVHYLADYLKYVSTIKGEESFFWDKISNDFITAYMNCSIKRGFFSNSCIIYGKAGSIFLLGYIFLEAIQKAKILGSKENMRSGEYLVSILKKGLADGSSSNPYLYDNNFDRILFKESSEKTLDQGQKLRLMKILGEKHFHYEPM